MRMTKCPRRDLKSARERERTEAENPSFHFKKLGIGGERPHSRWLLEGVQTFVEGGRTLEQHCPSGLLAILELFFITREPPAAGDW
jgi:hypothetical protein